jgi:thymidylate synthase (FAD)
MTIIEPSVEILDLGEKDGLSVLKKLEKIGRVCYKSEEFITDDSCIKFIQNIVKNKHEAILEHNNVTFKVICDRGVTHEIVRHRIASYAQESTRYVNYNKKGMTVIQPNFWSNNDPKDLYKMCIWENIMKQLEGAYNTLIEAGAKPEEARSVLPNSLKTEIVCTMNLRELRHFLKLRTAKVAHPQMRQVAVMLGNLLKSKLPIIFDDITYEETIYSK